MSGGDSFSDIYGVKLFIIQMFIKAAILLSGTLYILAPQTYGPFFRKWVKLVSNLYISKAKGVYARDEISNIALNKINNAILECVADLGLSMAFYPLPKRVKFTVGFNINGLLYQRDNLLGHSSNYQLLCDRIITLLKSNGYEVLLIPHVLGKEENSDDNDYYVFKNLQKSTN